MKKLVSGDLSGASFSQFVQVIESQSDYHFFFKAEQVDSLTISIQFKNQSLATVLDLVFRGTDLHYAIDDQHHVFVIKKYKIETELPAGFFRDNKRAADTTKGEEWAISDYSADEAKNEKLKTSLENKLFQIGSKSSGQKSGNATIAGYIRDIKTGETISGAAVFIDEPPIGVTTDQFGYFSFTLPRGRHVLRISSVGMKDTKRQVMLYSDGKLNIDMQEFVSNLKAVTIISEKNSNIRNLQMGVERLNIKTIKQVPMVFGEADVLRAILALPGVTSVGEGSTGFNVRGSSADQNLILFSDATVYNPSHFFGFFSAFNPDVVKDVELYKSGIPEKYGGRLASVLDISSRDGNRKKISGEGGVGPLTARLTLEGPIGSEKTTFVLGGRATYSDWLLKTIPNPDYSNSSASFYDANLHITHEMNAKNTLYLTGYLSSDQFRLNSDTLYKYSNKNANLKWKHIFNNKLYTALTAGYDGYDYSISSKSNPVNAYKFSFGVSQGFFKADFNYNLNSSNAVDFGVSGIYYKLQPGSMEPVGTKSLVQNDVLQSEQALETAVYLGDHITFSPKFSINAGIRYSLYDYLGPHDVYNYAPGIPRDPTTIIDTVSYAAGKSIQTYHGPEYRVAARFLLSDNTSLKASYNTLRQYIHLLSNTAAISPTDIWKLSDSHIQPITGDQFSLGLYQNFNSNTIETSVEVYYKRMLNYLDFKSGAQVVLNPHIETDVFTTRGKAYGIEFMIKKLAGKLNGWISYSYARTLLQEDDPIAGQTINNGNWYPSNFDKPNNVNFVGNYKINHRFSLSLNVTYSTGRPITLPVSIYYLAGSQRVFYSDRNQYRIPDYFRTDFSMNIEGSHKIKRFKHSSWTLGIYNVTARQNPYSVYFVAQNGVIQGYKLSIFGTAIPFVTYNFKF